MGRPSKEDAPYALKRIQMDFSPKPLARLYRLQERLECTSYSETVRRSLWLHETLLDLMGEDGRILVERGGVTTEVRIEGTEA